MSSLPRAAASCCCSQARCRPPLYPDVGVESAPLVAGQMRPAIVAEPAVLQADVVVVDGQDQYRSHREGVPVAAESPRPVVRQLEPRLVGEIPLRPVARLVLVVSCRGHPRPVPGGPHVVGEEGCPGRHRGVRHVRVAQIAVHQVEQRIERVHRVDDVGGVRAGRAEAAADRRRNGLISEAGEPKALRPAPRPGSEGAGNRLGAVVQDLVGVCRVGLEPVEPRMIGPDGLAGQRVRVDPLLRGHLDAEPAVGSSRPQPRPGHRCRGRPGNRDLRCGIRAELDVQLLGRRSTSHCGPAEQGRSLHGAR